MDTTNINAGDANVPTQLTPEQIEAEKKRLQDILRQRRAEKQKQEEQDELEREKRRRDEGKQMQEAALQNRQRSGEAHRQKLQRQREEDAKYAEQLKEQLRLDKLERAQRLSSSGQQKVQSSSSQSQTPSSPPSTSNSNSNSTSLRIKLPDGSTVYQQAEATSTLADLRLLLAPQVANLGSLLFKVNYPARTFATGEEKSSVFSLGLVPSANLLLVPKTSTSTTSTSFSSLTSNPIVDLVWKLLFAILVFLGLRSADESKQTQSSSSQSSSSYSSSSSRPTVRTSSDGPNIRGLKDTNKPEDQRDPKKKPPSYWNGNSTEYGDK